MTRAKTSNSLEEKKSRLSGENLKLLKRLKLKKKKRKEEAKKSKSLIPLRQNKLAKECLITLRE